jgi:hypothetical protein
MKEPEKVEELEEPKEEASEPVQSSRYGVTPFKSINSWGVKDRAGEWVVVKDNPQRAEHDACNITRREALRIFDTHPKAFQLIDGCDWWACLDDTPEVLVVKKEKTDVPADESLPGAGPASDGPGDPEEARSPAEDSSPGDD